MTKPDSTPPGDTVATWADWLTELVDGPSRDGQVWTVVALSQKTATDVSRATLHAILSRKRKALARQTVAKLSRFARTVSGVAGIPPPPPGRPPGARSPLGAPSSAPKGGRAVREPAHGETVTPRTPHGPLTAGGEIADAPPPVREGWPVIERELTEAVEEVLAACPNEEANRAVLAAYLDRVAFRFFKRWGSGRQIAAYADELRRGGAE